MDHADDEPREVENNAAEHRYEIRVGGDLAGYAAYQDANGSRVFTHTKIDPDYEGQGLGSTLVKAALDDVRQHQLTAVPRCPFVREYVQRHHDYDDIIAG